MNRSHLALFFIAGFALAAAPGCKQPGSDASEPGVTDPTTGAVTGPNGATGGNVTTGLTPGNTNVPAGTTDPNGGGVPLPPAPVPVCKLSAASDIKIVVTSKSGPNAFAAPIQLTQNLYSQGIDDRTRGDYMPTLNTKYVNYLKGLKPMYLRFPAGHNGQNYIWSTTAKDAYGIMSPNLIDRYMDLCKAVGAQPYMAVNISESSGTIADAVSMITYTNKTKGYNVKWWQIGNEPNLGSSSSAVTPAFTSYPSTYLAFRKAMLAVDPTIKFVGLESYQGMAVYRDAIDRGEADFFTPFLAQVGNQVDAIAWHYYQLYSGDARANTSGSSAVNSTNIFQEKASDWPPAGLTFADDIMPYMRRKMASVAPNAQIWIDEFAEDSGNQLAGRGVADTMAGALWAADVTGRYADQGLDGIFHFIFSAAGTPTLQFGYTLLDPNNDPRPEYYAYWLMSNHYGDQMVKTSTSAITRVASHAAISSKDGSLRVMLVNKTTTPQQVNLNLADYAPVRASQYVLTGASMSAKAATINGKTLTSDIAALGDAAVPAAVAQACTNNSFEVPPLSVSMVIFTNK